MSLNSNRIGLIDVDGHNGFPNLALMKLSAWHKSKGDQVEIYSPMFSGHMDIVYMSKVFTFTPDFEYFIDADEIIRGGTGYKDYITQLSEEAEHIAPDYSIYPKVDYAIGFLTRGCIRKCPWCVVPKKEGTVQAYDTWQNIKRPDTNRILFLDNNILASDHGIRQIAELSKTDLKIDFNQGLDARLIDDTVAEILSRCKWDSFIRMSCDTSQMIDTVIGAIERLQRHGVKPYKVFVYTLVQDVTESHKRILEISKTGAQPFAQPYRDFNGGEPTREQKRLARWCNRKEIFNSTSFEEYRR